MDNSFNEFLHRSRVVTNAGLAVLSAVSGYFTYEGAAMVLGATSSFSPAALVYAVGVSAMIFVFWHYVLHIVPRLQTTKTRLLGLCVVLLGGIFIVALSSWMNVMALAGAGAQEAILREATEAADRKFQDAASQAAGLDGIADELALNSTRYGDIAQSEIERGALTGSPGRGRVAESLLSSKATIDRLIATLQENTRNRIATIDEGEVILLRMDELSEAQMETEEKALAFKREMTALADIISRLEVKSDADAVARTMRALASQADLFAASDNRALARTQEEVIQRISDELETTGERIAVAADLVAAEEVIEAETFNRMSLAKAVFVYAGDLIPYWAGGIGMDLMPVALVLLLMLLFVTSRQNEPTDPDVGALPFSLVQKLFFELERMRGIADQEALEDNRQVATTLALPAQMTPDPEVDPEKEEATNPRPQWNDASDQDWKRFTSQA